MKVNLHVPKVEIVPVEVPDEMLTQLLRVGTITPLWKTTLVNTMVMPLWKILSMRPLKPQMERKSLFLNTKENRPSFLGRLLVERKEPSFSFVLTKR